MGLQRLRLPAPHPVMGDNRIFDAFEYAPAVVTPQGLVFVAGQVGLRPDGSIPTDPREQIECAFERCRAVLAALGLDFSDVVELVSYHVNLQQTLPVFRAVKSACIRDDFPTWTILGVAELARPELIVELKLVACLRDAERARRLQVEG